MLFKKKILEAIKNKENKDIFIIGKGPSVDGIDLKILKNKIVININNSAKEKNTHINLYIEFDCGANRCGIQSFKEID